MNFLAVELFYDSDWCSWITVYLTY